MAETFYAVQQVINGRSGCLPTKVETLDEAREFVDILKNYADSLEGTGTIEFRIYEVKEIV